MKVSVALFTYNHAPYLRQALESVLAQAAGFPFEVIIGEDASTDGTRDIVIEYATRYPTRIKPILHPRNVGGPANFKAILATCTGEYVALLDGDDYWTCPDKLQRQVDFLDHHRDCAVSFHNVQLLQQEENPGETRLLNPPAQAEMTSIQHLLRENYIGTASVMYRRELDRLLPDWLFEMNYPDWMLHLLHARFGQIGYLPEPMAVWRIHAGGFWSGRSKVERLQGEVEFYSRAEAILGSEWRSAVRGCLGETYLKLAHAAEKEGKRALARASALHAVRLNPSTTRSCAAIWLRVTAPGVYRIAKGDF